MRPGGRTNLFNTMRVIDARTCICQQQLCALAPGCRLARCLLIRACTHLEGSSLHALLGCWIVRSTKPPAPASDYAQTGLRALAQ